MDTLAQLTNVSKRHDSDNPPAAAHVSMEVSRGDSIAIIGDMLLPARLAGRTAKRARGRELLLDLNSSRRALILVTHNPDLAARYARRVIEIVDGQIASDASATGASR